MGAALVAGVAAQYVPKVPQTVEMRTAPSIPPTMKSAPKSNGRLERRTPPEII